MRTYRGEGARIRAEAKAKRVEGARIRAEAKVNRARLLVEGDRIRAEGATERARSRAENQAKCALQMEAEGDKRAIEERQILRLKLIEQAEHSTLPYLDFLSRIQKRKKSTSLCVQPIVIQAITKVFPDNNRPLTSMLMFRLNKLAQYIMHTTEGSDYKFQFKGRVFYCKEGPCRFVCATHLSKQVLSDLVRDAEINPASSTWPTNTECPTRIKAPLYRTLWEKWAANQSKRRNIRDEV
jgi:hypothetical protein